MKARIDRWWNFAAALMLLAAFMMTALKIQSTNWTEDLHLMNWLTTIGFILGAGLGYSKFRGFVSRLFIIFYSIFIVPYAIGTTYNSGILWLTRFESLYGRIYYSIEQLLNNVRIEDPILFFIFLCLLVWFTSITGGFLLTRSARPWTQLLISGITIFTSEFYDQIGNNLYTAFFIFFVLVFLAQNYYVESNRTWRLKGIPVDFETEPLIRRSAFIVAFVIIFIAWNSTNIVSAFQKGSQQQKQIIGFIEDIQLQFSKLTAPLQGTAFLQSEFFGDTINLGTGSNLSDEVVLEIAVNQKKPSGSRYYWRARSYDQFINNQWISSFDSSKLIEANSDITDSLEYFFFPQRTFTIKTRSNLGLLYTPPYPQKINRPVKAFFANLSDDKVDYIALTLEEIAFSGETYEVVNRIPTPTITQMRKSSNEYPDWVLLNYLQLPPDFSEKIRNLAIEITESYSNPYDKTQAITNYLRKNITYKEQIPAPPLESNLIEWFLFEHKEGFCNYYATTEVLMLRSIGIPSRIVFGYAQGESQNPDESEFIVRKEQSHAWPEVFFEGIGWVEFEPTTIQPTLDRLLGETVDSISDIPSVRDPNRQDLPVMDGGESIGVGGEIPDTIELEELSDVATVEPTILPFIFMGIVVLFSIILMFKDKPTPKSPSTPVIIETFLVRRGWKIPNWLKQWSSFSRNSAAEKEFAKIIWSLSMFKKLSFTSFTPAEVVKEYKTIFPEMSKEIDMILVEYQKAIYSPHPINLKMIQDQSNQILKYSIIMKIKSLFQFRNRYSH
ncbi:MAG: transglutaminase domain-containing protein [Anaerolineaceae bacterium]|nr:transglutaminase domain-containing protein [Anaerolineaceae bacterium]